MSEQELAKAIADLFTEMWPPKDYHETCNCKSCTAYRKIRDWLSKPKEDDLDSAGHY